MFVVQREPHNPILSPRREHPWEAFGTYNPSVLKEANGVRMYYRALSNPAALVSPYAGQSTIGMAFAEDGTHFHSRRQVIIPQEPWEAYGCEDPRATYFEGKWYIFYTALGGYPFGPDNIKVGVAIGSSPESFPERHLVTPFNAKAATLFPSRINGEVVMLLAAHTDHTPEHPRPTIAIARAKNIEDFWSPGYWEAWHAKLPDHAMAELRRSDDDHVEVGAPPILTDKGWLLFYSNIQHYYDERRRIFGVEALLLDHNDPRKVISRSYPFFVPEEIYERYGIIPNVVFPTGVICDNDRIDLYYGAADTTCAKASIRLADILDALLGGRKRALTRASENPILAPQGNGFEKSAVFNAAAIDLEGSVHLLYRAMGDDHTSVIGYARSKDGIHIDERHPAPCYTPRADFEMKHRPGNSGCEDPRVIALHDRLYMTYTAYDGVKNPRGAITSISIADFLAKKFDKWTMPALITPDEVDDKDVGLLPDSVGGEYLLYHRVSGRICADLLPDLSMTKRVTRCIEIMGGRDGLWDEAKIGIAGSPIRVPGGWIMIYHGISRHARYRLGAALLDPSGQTLLSRTADPIFEPVEPYEVTGEVENVVFSCGQVVRGDTVFVYYGGGDKVIGVATTSLAHLHRALLGCMLEPKEITSPVPSFVHA